MNAQDEATWSSANAIAEATDIQIAGPGVRAGPAAPAGTVLYRDGFLAERPGWQVKKRLRWMIFPTFSGTRDSGAVTVSEPRPRDPGLRSGCRAAS
eukprot:768664-Hanusia_phi.AAC.5